MTGFEYHRPGSLAEASELLARPGSVALAGGTDLMVAVRHRKMEPTSVVDLKSISDLDAEIVSNQGILRIGGRVTMSKLTRNDQVRTHFPALAQAASVVGSVQIRNRATLSGNLCNASPAADTAPALLAYGASVGIEGTRGRRVVPLEEFFLGPAVTVLVPGELVTTVELPIPSPPVGSAFARVTRRRGVDLASVNLACAVDSSGGVRFGFGAVAPTPLSATTTLADLAVDRGWEALFAGTSPISDVRAGADYRRAMLEVHSKRALAEANARLAAN